MTVASAPTQLHGIVGDSVWDAWLAETIEYVPDLMWPLSVATYAQMRRDPQLAAILAAYTLPLRRASWTVDPAGCRPEVAQLVADDLDLPLAGVDKPGAARTRGVSWPEHLRSALSMLTFGHAGFEQLAEITDGRARLVGLYERSQASIGEIHIDDRGGFAGISQTMISDSAEITADRMIWYSHDREATAWQGTSLLRPAYAPWLLKRELQRVLATSSRRFGMGVPTVRALPGTHPTPAQMTQAATFAQTMRGGETAGGVIPPGFVVELQGLLGGVPNTLEFIRWLDQQMSGMALARWMDLGDTSNGSRALGEAFVDTFLLALQAIADQVADTVTRQAAARIVAWNWGEDEPVPKVTVSDVGSRHEVTAEALQALVASGAIVPDPALRAWVRRTYRLPVAETPPPAVPKPKTSMPVDAPSGDAPGPADVSRVAAAAGHASACDEASLISVCQCGCHGTRHGDHRARTRLGPIRSEDVERRDGNIQLTAMTDDELAALFARHSREENWDAFAAVDAEMVRREDDAQWLDPPAADAHWDTGGEPSDTDRQIDVLLAQGYDFIDAFAEVHGQDAQRLHQQERSSAVDRQAGEDTDAAVRRSYDEWVHEQWLRAETDTRGHLLTPQAQAQGIDPVELFSGPAARARKWASEDLLRWWGENQRLTFTGYRAQALGRHTDRQKAEKIRLGSNARDYI